VCHREVAGPVCSLSNSFGVCQRGLGVDVGSSVEEALYDLELGPPSRCLQRNSSADRSRSSVYVRASVNETLDEVPGSQRQQRLAAHCIPSSMASHSLLRQHRADMQHFPYGPL
jgi:hypothetical protein